MNNFNAYIAGYIDGDGCLYIGKYQQKNTTVYELKITICSVKRDPLDLFLKKFGGRILKQARAKPQRDAYIWSISNKKAQSLLQKIYPYLKDKKNQCEHYLTLYRLIRKNKFKKMCKDKKKRRNDLIKKCRDDKHLEFHINQSFKEYCKSINFTKTPTDKDYAYLAGVIDSEGCFRVKKWKPKDKPNYVYAINLSVGNTRKPILEFLISFFGGSICIRKKQKNSKVAGVWEISAAKLFSFIHKIMPYLTVKFNVCKEVVKFQRTIISNGGDRHSENFKKLYQEVLTEREGIISKIQAFNKKGK